MTMKKILLSILIITILPTQTLAADNPMFGIGHDNSVSVFIGQSTGPDTMFKMIAPHLWDFYSQTFFMANYSQPITIFRLPARQSIAFVHNISYENSHGLSFTAAGLSWDVALLNWNGWYLGIGLGPYFKDTKDRWVESRLVFGEKFFIGKNINDRWRAELMTLHMSNGNFTPINRGFNWAGLSVSYSF